MAAWNEGYVSDIVYTRRFHRETTPAWLAAATLLLGHRPPDLTRPFRYADLGCGHGQTAIIVAATYPNAEVWGFDFNPAHVESARELASHAGLTNVRFQETSFAELAAADPSAMPAFDFMVSHGIMSWVSQDNQRHLVRVISQRLRPGGLAYLSYNVATGWGAMPPLRALMRALMLSNADRSDRAVPGVLDYLARLRDAGARFFAANPSMAQRLSEIRRQDPRYVAHEFLNQDWHPLMFADVARMMGDAKCSYIGSATLQENIDAVSLPPDIAQLLVQTPDPVMRETLRDFGTAQEFRRDIYRRGITPMMAAENARVVCDLTVQWTGKIPPDPTDLSAPAGLALAPPEAYAPLLETLMARRRTISDIHRSELLAGCPLAAVLQAITLLMAAGYVHPVVASADASSNAGVTRLNAAIGAANADGAGFTHLAAPVIGSAVAADLLETLVVADRLSGRPIEATALTDRLLGRLAEGGRTVRRDGQDVIDPDTPRKVLRQAVDFVLETRLPVLARLGVVPAANELRLAGDVPLKP